MAVIRINKNKNYTIMSNYHFREKDMSLKAKGLLSLMLSLPDDWNYSIAGLVSICKENETAIKNTLNELQQFGYLKVIKLMPCKEENRSKIEYIYDVFEEPQEGKNQGVENLPLEEKTPEKCGNSDKRKAYQEGKNQGLDNLPLDDLPLENQGQLNTKEVNTKKLNTKNNINIIDENFERVWKMLKSTPHDRKAQVKPKRKKELFEMGIERVEKAINLYLKTQDPRFTYKRDRFLNEIIDNYLDKDETDFYGSAPSYDLDKWEKESTMWDQISV